MNKQERRAADQTEYELSIQRAAEAQREQLVAQASASAIGTYLQAGLVGLVVRKNAKRKLIPPRPDQ